MIERLKKFGKSLLICFLYIVVIPGMSYAFLLTKDFDNFSSLKQNMVLILTELIIFVMVTFIFRKTLINDFKDFKVNFKKYFKIILKYFVIGLGIMIVSNFLINYVFFKGSIALNEEANRANLVAYPIYSIVTLILLGPVSEELVFRANFKNSIKNKTLFLIFTSLLFGSMHLLAYFDTMADIASSWQQLLYIIPYGALGVVFGLTYLKTNNIYSAIMIHMLQNIISVGVILLVL